MTRGVNIFDSYYDFTVRLLRSNKLKAGGFAGYSILTRTEF
jgi:hypothetical protein